MKRFALAAAFCLAFIGTRAEGQGTPITSEQQAFLARQKAVLIKDIREGHARLHPMSERADSGIRNLPVASTRRKTITTACSGTAYYVSATGNDSNNGLSTSTPWLSIAKVNNGASYGGGGLSAGQCVYFHGGDSWTGCASFTAGDNIASSSAVNPIIISGGNAIAWGTGNPTINANCSTSLNGTAPFQSPQKNGAINIDSHTQTLAGLVLQNITLRRASGNANYGVLIQNNFGGTANNITVSDMDISGFRTSADNNLQYEGAEIEVMGYSSNGGCNALDTINIIGNTLHGATVTAADGSGVGSVACSNITNLTVTGNTIYNMGNIANSTTGLILMDGVTTGTVKYNLLFDGGANTRSCGGMSGIETTQVSGITIAYNEVFRMQPIFGAALDGCDWDGIDLDLNSQNNVVEYNYTHDNAGSGFTNVGNDGTPWGNNTWRYNISENDSYIGGTNQGGAFYWTMGGQDATIFVYNNTIYVNADGSKPNAAANVAALGWGKTNSPAVGSIFANNIFAITHNNAFSWCNVYDPNIGKPMDLGLATWRNNAYWLINGGTLDLTGTTFASFQCPANGSPDITTLAQWNTMTHGTGSIQTAPVFAGTPPTGTCTWTPTANTGPQQCPSSYKLTSAASAYLGTGVNLTIAPYNLSVGATDYFLNPIPHTIGTGFNIGAYGGNPSLPTNFKPHIIIGN